MTVLDGFEDLQPKRILGPGGKVAVEGVKNEMEVFVGPGGVVFLRHPEPVPIDQTGEKQVRTMAEKWAGAGIDQPT